MVSSTSYAKAILLVVGQSLVSVIGSLASAQTAQTVPAPAAAQPEGAAAAAAVLEFRSQPRPPMPIRITQAEWTAEAEERFSAFVQQVGRGIARRPLGLLKNYMRDPAINPYANTDPPGLIHYSDCADFPYFLRAYFAFKNGLPMSVAFGAEMNRAPYASRPTRDGDLTTARLDNSPYGNFLTSRVLSNIPSAPGRERNFLNYWSSVIDAVSTRTLRVGPLSPNYALSDIYPVKINRRGVRPGTIVHSNGHVLIVYDVDARGAVHAMDAHPDNSNQIKVIDASNLDRSRPDHGFGFFRFRPSRAIGGQVIGGAIYGATIQTVGDAELYAQGLYSLEQWFGPESNVAPGSRVAPTAWENAFGEIDFFDFVRLRMRGNGRPLLADEAFADQMLAVCEMVKQRPPDIQQALNAGLTRLPHPTEIPANVFSTEGPWETYSTPSRDGRMRYGAAALPRQAVSRFKMGAAGRFGLTFSGSAADYQRSILARLAVMNSSCTVTYAKSNGARVTLNFSDMIRRMPRMSFDPYHCAEKRWGARSPELDTCVDGDTGHQWFSLQQSMRNTVGKQDSNERLVLRSDRPITLEMLASGRYVDQPNAAISLGSSRSSIRDVEAYFASPQFLNDLNR